MRRTRIIGLVIAVVALVIFMVQPVAKGDGRWFSELPLNDELYENWPIGETKKLAWGVDGNISWEITELRYGESNYYRKLRVSGNGPMNDYEYPSVLCNDPLLCPWILDISGNRGTVHGKYFNAIVIDPGITSIGNFAFYVCLGRSVQIDEVVIPDTVTRIGENAFETQDHLQRIYVPDSVTSFGENAIPSRIAICCSENSEAYRYATSPDRPFHNEVILTDTPHRVKPDPTVEPAATPAPEGLEINETNFPDEAFRNYVHENLDRYYDYILTDEEIEKVYGITCENCGISSLKGIELFPNMWHLDCSNNQLTELDLSRNPGVTSLRCNGNILTKLDISNNPGLTLLCCSANQLTKLDISHNPELNQLDCRDNPLTELDVSNSQALKSLAQGLSWGFGFLYVDDGVNIITGEPDPTPTPKPTPTPTPTPRKSTFDYYGGRYEIIGKTATLVGVTDKSITSLEIPDKLSSFFTGETWKVTGIASGACKGLKQLTSVSIGANVKTIGDKAFYKCKKLKTITIKTKKLKSSTVGKNAFTGTVAKATYKCPSGKVKSYKTILLDKGASKKATFK